MEETKTEIEDTELSTRFRKLLRKTSPWFKGFARCVQLAYMVGQFIEWLG